MTAAPNEPTDESLALTAAARAADAQTAFGVLMRRYTVRLLRYLSSLSVPEADADDLASGVWFQVWQKLPAWKPDHFRGWLFTIARRRATDFHRTPTRAAPLDGMAEPTAKGPSAEQVAVDREFADKLRKCHEKMPDKFRLVFDRMMAGESYEQIAEWEQVPLGTVQSRINRARTALKKCVGLEVSAGEESDES
jgi:RNA polymerase sigma factor (sigma-70 family)